MPPKDLPQPGDLLLSGPFVGEIHGTVFPAGTDQPGVAVTIGVVVCPQCSGLVFAPGIDSHQTRHRGGRN